MHASGGTGRLSGRVGGRVVVHAGPLAVMLSAVLLSASAQYALAADPEQDKAAAAEPANDGVPAEPETPTDFATLVRQLGDESFAVREKAQRTIEGSEAISLKAIEAYVRAEGAGLTLEQRERLIAAGRARFIATDRAALGVQFSFALPNRAVIEQTFAPFDSQRVLQAGDIISEIGGVQVEGPGAQSIVRAAIFSRDPGDVVPITVRRGGEMVRSEVRLGRFSDLNGAQNFGNRVPDADLLAAWRVRSRSYAGGGTPIRAVVAAEAWKPESTAERLRDMRFKQINAGEAVAPEVVAGGVPRGASALEPGQQLVQRNGMVVQVQALPRMMERELERRMTPAEELQRLATTRRNLADNLRALVDARGAAPGNAQVETAITDLERRIAALDRARTAIEREITDKGGKVPELKPAPGEDNNDGLER